MITLSDYERINALVHAIIYVLAVTHIVRLWAWVIIKSIGHEFEEFPGVILLGLYATLPTLIVSGFAIKFLEWVAGGGG